eukprot:c28856_g1_i4 orf=191-673(+)
MLVVVLWLDFHLWQFFVVAALPPFGRVWDIQSRWGQGDVGSVTVHNQNTSVQPVCSLKIPCAKLEPPPVEDVVYKQPSRSFEDDVDEHGWRLCRSQLEAIAASSDIRQMLKDKNLQKLILKIDSSSNAEEDLDKAMEMDLFHEFSNKIFAVLNPIEEPCT